MYRTLAWAGIEPAKQVWEVLNDIEEHIAEKCSGNEHT